MFVGLFCGTMAFTVASFDPKNIEGYNFLGVFLWAFFIASSSILTKIIELIFSKIFAVNNN